MISFEDFKKNLDPQFKTEPSDVQSEIDRLVEDGLNSFSRQLKKRTRLSGCSSEAWRVSFIASHDFSLELRIFIARAAANKAFEYINKVFPGKYVVKQDNLFNYNYIIVPAQRSDKFKLYFLKWFHMPDTVDHHTDQIREIKNLLLDLKK